MCSLVLVSELLLSGTPAGVSSPGLHLYHPRASALDIQEQEGEEQGQGGRTEGMRLVQTPSRPVRGRSPSHQWPGLRPGQFLSSQVQAFPFSLLPTDVYKGFISIPKSSDTGHWMMTFSFTPSNQRTRTVGSRHCPQPHAWDLPLRRCPWVGHVGSAP